MRPEQLITKLKETAQAWKFEVASIGFPVPVRKGRIAGNPKHLGKGWVGFNFAKALGVPIRLINDAAMQALGSYQGRGRLLFLGGLAPALAPRWFGKRPRCRSSLATCRIPMATSSKNYLGVPGLALLAKRNGNEK